MRSLLLASFYCTTLLLTGCGKEEKKDEPSTLPDADKFFDKSKTQPLPPGGKKDKGSIG